MPQKVLAVRGPLSRNYLLENGVDCPDVYGDPALLFPKYYKPHIYKKYKLGIIAENLGIKVDVAHRALADVDTLVKVFNVMLGLVFATW